MQKISEISDELNESNFVLEVGEKGEYSIWLENEKIYEKPKDKFFPTANEIVKLL